MKEQANDNGTPEGEAFVDEWDAYIRTGDPRPLARRRATLRARPRPFSEDDARRLRIIDDLLSNEPLRRLK